MYLITEENLREQANIMLDTLTHFKTEDIHTKDRRIGYITKDLEAMETDLSMERMDRLEGSIRNAEAWLIRHVKYIR